MKTYQCAPHVSSNGDGLRCPTTSDARPYGIACRFLVVWLWLLCVVGGCSGDPTAAELMQLQEKCATAANRAFDAYKKEVGVDTYRPNGNKSYTNHYSVSKRRCYVQISDVRWAAEDRLHAVYLMDVLDNKLVASYVKNSGGLNTESCLFGQQICNTFQEYQQLSKPYMEQ